MGTDQALPSLPRLSFWCNVASREIGCFLLAEMIIFAVAFLASLYVSYELALFLFAVFTLSCALLYPVVRGIDGLPNNAVDFWYYSFGVVGILLLGMNNWSEREKTRISNEYISLGIQLQKNEKEKALIDRISPRREYLLLEIRTHGAHQKELITTAEPECAEIELRQRMRKDLTRTQEDASLVLKKDQKIGVDLTLDALRCARVHLKDFWSAVADAKNAADVITIVKGEKRSSDVSWYLLDTSMSLRQAVKYLEFDHKGIEYKRIEEGISTIALRRKQMEGDFEKIGASLASQSLFSLLVRNVSQFIWPYLVIVALGMKIARRKFISISKA